MREDDIHFSVRQALRQANWILIAGQYPNGSDDELPSLNVMDPLLARDKSPDHRRHSKNKLVPDLVAVKDHYVIVIEMKPAYDVSDVDKLNKMLGSRRADFISSFRKLVSIRDLSLEDIDNMKIIPCLAFARPKNYPRNSSFTYFYVTDKQVYFDANGIISSL